MTNFQDKVGFISSVADLLRGDYNLLDDPNHLAANLNHYITGLSAKLKGVME
jgi:hypothetical protein